MFKLTGKHHRKCWRKGDLEDETVLCDSLVFKTRKEANSILEDYAKKYKRMSFSVKSNIVSRGKPSTVTVFTGDTWIHENSGEKMEEYYHFIVEKC